MLVESIELETFCPYLYELLHESITYKNRFIEFSDKRVLATRNQNMEVVLYHDGEIVLRDSFASHDFLERFHKILVSEKISSTLRFFFFPWSYITAISLHV